MEIIKHGKNYKQITCSKCGCVFGYMLEDTFHDFSSFRYVRCPECDEKIDVSVDIMAEATKDMYKTE